MKKKITLLLMLMVSCFGFAQNYCATAPTDCNLVYNGDFEQNSGIPDAYNQLSLACNWEVYRGSPDYFHMSAPHISPYIPDIPTNFDGTQGVFAGGQAYGGYVIYSDPVINYENLRTRLIQPLTAGKTYRLTLNISRADNSNKSAEFQAYIGNTLDFDDFTPGFPVIMESNGILLDDNHYVTTVDGWETMDFTFTAGAGGQEYLYLGAFNVQFQNETVGGLNKAYYYIDNVKLVEVQNFAPQLSLPTVSLCTTSAAINLADYLTGGVTGGVFSGPGVTFSGGIYTFNPSTAGAGTHTITYTIPSPIACPPVITTDDIKVVSCSTPYISQTYSYGTNDKYIEVKNPGPTGIGGIGTKYYLVSYPNGASTTGIPPAANCIYIGVLNANTLKVFKDPSAMSPYYVSATSWTALSNFDGNGDIIILTTSTGANAFADRVDIFGDPTAVGQSKSLVRVSCAAAPGVTFNEWDWVAFTDGEVADANSKTNAVLGRHWNDALTYSSTGWSDAAGISNPDRSRAVVIDANYTTGTGTPSFEACSLLVNPGRNLLITTGNYVSVQSSVDVVGNGNLTINDGGSLVQVRDQYYGGSGTDLITLNSTNTNMKATKTTVNLDTSNDFMYWSSPLSMHQANPKLNQIFSFGGGTGQFSAATFYLFKNENYCDIYHRFSGINGATDDFDDNYNNYDAVNTATEQNAYMTPGKGYATLPPVASGGNYNYTVNFIGEMNNGIVTVPVYRNNSLDGDNFNMVGNPYPSAIDLDVFFAENSTLIEPLALLWSRVNDNPSGSNDGPGATNYSAGNFALYTTDMSLVTGEYGTYLPGDVVASGQSFQIRTPKNFTGFTQGPVAAEVVPRTLPHSAHPNEEIILAGNLVFKNNMRTTLPNTVLMKGATAENPVEKGDKLWVNLTDDDNYAVQLGIYFKPTGTVAYKQGEDISSIHGRRYNFYTQSTAEDLIIDIQDGFKADKVIPLGIYNVSGKTNKNFTISIPKTGGIFNTQTVYLEDRQLGTIHNLSDSDYAFAATENVVEGRFALRFTTGKINNDTISEMTGNEVTVIMTDNDVVVKSKNQNIKGLYVSDIYTPNSSGLLLAKADNINGKTARLNVPEKYKLLSVKIILEDGSVVSKKIMR